MFAIISIDLETDDLIQVSTSNEIAISSSDFNENYFHFHRKQFVLNLKSVQSWLLLIV